MNNQKFILLLSFFLILATFLLFYLYTSEPKEIVILSSDNTKTKKKPKDPGGIVIPNSDSLIYDKLRKTNIASHDIRITSITEKPLRLKRNLNSQPKFLDSIDKILFDIEQHEKKIVKKDNDSRANNETTHVLHSADTKTPKLQITTGSGNRYKEKSPSINSITKENGYKIQLAVSYSFEDIAPYWHQIKTKHKILARADLITKKIKGKNERIFYLIMAGTYPSLSQAKLVCRKLSSAKQNCIITK